MGQNTSRRSVLQGLITSAIVIGFDLTTRSWVTSASATSIFESLPSDWQQHFRPVWGNLVSAKRRYDPDNLLTPSQGIFANC